MTIPKYWVATECEEAVRIYFDSESAFKCPYQYLDVFDKGGERIEAYKNLSTIPEVPYWTTDF